MGKLSTKNINTDVTGSSIPKTVSVGNHELKINGVELEENTYKPGAYNLVLHVETKPIEDFEGWLINKDDPSMGTYKGQTGKVKATEWSFVDAETKSGIAINRDQEILKFIKRLCLALGTEKWLTKNDDKHETIEAYVKAFNTDQPFDNKFIHFCLGGKEYTNKGGYKAYDLFLPNFSKDGNPISATELGVLKFDEAKHVRKPKVTKVDGFGGSEIDLSDNSDFKLQY